MRDAPRDWYADEKMIEAVNRCMDAIHAAGLSADSAEYLPECLEQAIRASNLIAAKQTQFVQAPISVKAAGGGYDITPLELSFLQ